MILYGLTSCDTCRKARKALEAAGHSVAFRDIRAEPLSPDERAEFLDAFGDRLINRKSTSWRGLSDRLRDAPADAQLAAQPTLMKRPVIRADDKLHLGWDKAVQAVLLG
jgi:arsenate reductase (glutaredoxin)